MSLFKRIYDWLLSLFWYARSVVSLFLIYMLIELVFCPGAEGMITNSLTALATLWLSATVLDGFVLIFIMLMPCACAM